MAVSAEVSLDERIAAAGGPTAVGKALGVHHATVIGWRRANHVPAERVPALAELLGVTRHSLRPDLYESQAA